MEIRLQEAVPVSAIPKLIKLADTICTPLPRCNQEAVKGPVISKLIKLVDATRRPTSIPDKSHMAGDNKV